MRRWGIGDHHTQLHVAVIRDYILREFYSLEKNNASLNEDAKNKWHVVSMKNDWKEIF